MEVGGALEGDVPDPDTLLRMEMNERPLTPPPSASLLTPPSIPSLPLHISSNLIGLIMGRRNRRNGRTGQEKETDNQIVCLRLPSHR